MVKKLTQKRVILITVVAMFTVLLLISSTLAYLTDAFTVTNTLRFGEITIDVTEEGWPSGGGTKTIEPGALVTKKPVVTNKTGADSVPCYVRATIAIGVTGGGQVLPQGKSIMDYLQIDGLNAGWSVLGTGTWGSSHLITVYYTQPLQPGDSTSAIFNGFKLLETSGGVALLEGANTGFNLNINVEAVQANVNGKPYDSALDAFAAVDASTP